MLMLIEASSTQSMPTAIHSVGECGMNSNAIDASIAPNMK
jgi:hypothetical protein